MHQIYDQGEDRTLLIVAGPSPDRDDWVDRCADRSLPGADRIDMGSTPDDDETARGLLRHALESGRSAVLNVPTLRVAELLAMAKAREAGMSSMLVVILPPVGAATAEGWPPALADMIRILPSALQQAQDWMIMVRGFPTAAVAFDGSKTVVWDPEAYRHLPPELVNEIMAWSPLSTDGARATPMRPRLLA